MPHVTFVEPSGQARTVAGDPGQSVMHVARRHGIDGVVGECNGSLACATCHVHVAQEWRAIVGGPGPDEADMLDFTSGRTADSRLSCQIRLVPAMDGLIVTVAERQG